jgi:hypothetical protein
MPGENESERQTGSPSFNFVWKSAQNHLPAHLCGQELWRSRSRWDGTQILSQGLARPSICNNLERDLLSIVEAIHPGTLDRADVHKDIIPTVVRLDEAEAFLAIEPLHGSLRHVVFFQARM